jgi:hypothetical protein
VPTDEAALTLTRVWREMTPAQRAAAAECFWLDGDSMNQQLEAVTFLARQLKFRPHALLALPVERRTRQLAMAQRPPEAVIGRALVVYHLATQRPMLQLFLDRLGIPHEQGLIAETPAAPPAAEPLRAAAAAIAAAFPADDVRLYLHTLAVQDPDTWGALASWSSSAPQP